MEKVFVRGGRVCLSKYSGREGKKRKRGFDVPSTLATT